jgi:hypothetical protein
MFVGKCVCDTVVHQSMYIVQIHLMQLAITLLPSFPLLRG